MTGPLDDVYSKPSQQYWPVTVSTVWNELEPLYNSVQGLNVPASLSQIGQQIGPDGYTVEQSFDDGLPDAVTSTGTFDASGSLTMDLVGRPGLYANPATLSIVPSVTGGSGIGTSITTSFPTGLGFWDYTICAVTVQNNSLVTETSMPVTSYQNWKLLGESTNVVGGTTYRTWVFGRRHYTSGVVTPVFSIATSGNWGWVMGAIACPKAPGWDVFVGLRPGDMQTNSETVSQTLHSQTPVALSKGWTIGIFGTGSGAGLWTSSSAIIGQTGTGGPINIAMMNSALKKEAGTYPMTASTAVATQGVAMVHLAVEIMEYPAMDAAGWYSPLNKTSPIADFERDTSPVAMAINNIAQQGDGQTPTVIMRGQMAGIAVNGSKATLTGVSKTRLLLDNSKLLPTVYGWREGLTTDWLATWLLAQGRQYPGIAPSIYTRWWAPCHGSLHPHMSGSSDFTVTGEYRTEWGTDNFKRVSPTSLDGPFVSGMFAWQTDTSVIQSTWDTDRNWPTEVPGVTGALMQDILSQRNSVGRFTFWVKGDWFSAAPSSLISDNTKWRPFLMILWNYDQTGALINYIKFSIKEDRNLALFMGSTEIALTGNPLPIDNLWHFIGVEWDYAGGVGRVSMDGVTWTPSLPSAAAQTLPNTQAGLAAAGGSTNMEIVSRLPVSEMQLESGMPYTDYFTRFYPTPASPSKNATYRPSRQKMVLLAEPTPVQGWAALQSLAQSTLSHLRLDENDNAVFVSLDYFGETAQTTVDTVNVLDTTWNAGQVALNIDPTKTRNVITTQFGDTRVGTMKSPILQLTTTLAVPRGVTQMIFTLDTPTVETDGAALWWTSAPEFTKLTALQVAGTNPLPNSNFMSVNTLVDGTGTVFTSSIFSARIVDWSSNQITVGFVNNYSSTLYLVNNGSSIPFLQALGFAISVSDGYTTVSDSGSVNTRNRRALTTEVDWIQDRETAQRFSTTLLGLLSQPTQEVTVTVVGDPRRIPGKLVQLLDSTGTRADGTWRINAVTHRGNGSMYVQDLALVRVPDFGDWDYDNWDDAVWG